MALIYEDETYQILGACFEVYKEKGCGFHEQVFQECLEIEFRLRNVPAISKPKLKLEYKGHALVSRFEPDFVCYGQIILELKAVSKIVEDHESQVLNYLKASTFKLGLLTNFGHHPRLEHKRYVASDHWRPTVQTANEKPNLHA
jgi:GxxExxY protein